MRVVNYYKWGKFKRKVAFVSFIVAIGLVGGIERETTSNAVTPFVFALAFMSLSTYIMVTMKEREW